MKKRTAGQVESPSRNIRHFTDRENERDLFARYLDRRQGEHLPVLFFYGVGGTGKTWLLQKLREIVSSRDGVPHAHLDFSLLRGGEVYRRDHAAALAEIQRQLGIDCPRFEVAYDVMLWKRGKRDTASSSVEGAASTGWQIAIAPGTRGCLPRLCDARGQEERGQLIPKGCHPAMADHPVFIVRTCLNSGAYNEGPGRMAHPAGGECPDRAASEPVHHGSDADSNGVGEAEERGRGGRGALGLRESFEHVEEAGKAHGLRPGSERQDPEEHRCDQQRVNGREAPGGSDCLCRGADELRGRRSGKGSPGRDSPNERGPT
jgi:hypothetical protein